MGVIVYSNCPLRCELLLITVLALIQEAILQQESAESDFEDLGPSSSCKFTFELIEDVDDCTKYFQCFPNDAGSYDVRHYECPEGGYFLENACVKGSCEEIPKPPPPPPEMTSTSKPKSTTTREHPYYCGDESQIFSHKKDCQIYYTCHKVPETNILFYHVKHSNRCRGKHYFDKEKKDCVKGDCPYPGYPPIDKSPRYTHICYESGPGSFENPYKCSEYIECSIAYDGTIKACKPDSYFNLDLGKCKRGKCPYY